MIMHNSANHMVDQAPKNFFPFSPPLCIMYHFSTILLSGQMELITTGISKK